MEAPEAQVATAGARAALVLGQRWGRVAAGVKELPSPGLLGQAGGRAWAAAEGEACFPLVRGPGGLWAHLPRESHPPSPSRAAGMFQPHFADEETKAPGSGPSPGLWKQ